MKAFLASMWFQLCWFIAVLGTYRWQWLMLVITIATLVYCWKRDRSALKRIFVIAVIGVGVDTLNQRFSIIIFPTQWLPIWLLCLWILFSWYAHQLREVLHRFRPVYVLLVGGVGGAVSYFAGLKLHAVEFGYDVTIALAVLFVEWCAVMFLILKVYENEKFARKLNHEPD